MCAPSPKRTPATSIAGRYDHMMLIRAGLLLLMLSLATAAVAADSDRLRVVGNTHALEMAPVMLAARGRENTVSVADGGLDDLFRSGGADLVADTETLTLRVSVAHPEVRVIFTVAEGYCRIVARKSAGIGQLTDLKGKKIGTIAGSPFEYSALRLLNRAGLNESDATIVPLGSLAEAAAALQEGQVDALSLPEPAMQEAVDRLGSDAIEFQNRAVYRELFNLNTTAEKLADPAKRRQIVDFVSGLIEASRELREGGAESAASRQQAYYGTLVHDLPDVMSAEDGWLARQSGRAARTRAEMVAFVDPSVRLDAVVEQQSAGTRRADDTATRPNTLRGARERIERLSVGVDNVEAIRAVKVLQYAYAQYIEQGRWKDARALFADGAVAQFGSPADGGKEGLADGRLNLRVVLSPVINLSADGMHAKGRWHEVALLGEFGKSARWEGGIYENDYVLEKGVWKIASLHYYPQYAGPYESGWRSLPQASAVVPYHYDARSAGMPIPEEARDSKRVKLQQSLPALAAHLVHLEQRVQRLNDAAEVQNLQHACGYYADRKLWEDVADLFIPQNRAEILRGSGAAGLHRGELNDHLQLETIVNVAPDGRIAHTRGIQLGMTSSDGSGQWSESLYDGEYVKTNGVWMIDRIRTYPRMSADYAVGWAKSPLGPFPTASFPNPAKRTNAAKPVAGTPARTLPELLSRLGELERKLTMAEAYDGAENVSNAYGYYIDEFRWNDTAELFAKEGWKELSYIGTYVGREHVRQSMTLRYGSNGRTGKMMTLHQKTQPVVDVLPDGTARIRERLFQINSVTDAPGSYIGGIYENEVVREDGVWKISTMDLDYVWTTSYTTGWAHETTQDGMRFAPPPTATPPPLAPDRPLRGVVTAPFPEIVDVPFHYRNRVSGRAPAVLLLP